MIVRVKYCGGCNSSYDRPAFVRRLQDAFPSARFLFSDAGPPDLVLVVCGCPVACAAREDVQGRGGRLVVTSQNDFALASDEIRRRKLFL